MENPKVSFEAQTTSDLENKQSISRDFNLRVFIDESVSLFMRRLSERKIRVYATVDPAVPRDIFANPTQLLEIIETVMSGSAEIMREGTLFWKVTVDQRSSSDLVLRWVFSCANHMPIENGNDAKSVVQKAFSYLESKNLQYDGILDPVCEYSFELSFSVPVKRSQNFSLYRGRPTLHHRRVLILSSDSWLPLRVGEQLLLRGLVPQSVASIEAALQAVQDGTLKQKPIDLMVMDSTLNGKSAEDLLDIFNQHQIHIPTICLIEQESQVTSTSLAERPFKILCLRKPVWQSCLYQSIASLLEKS